MRLSWLLRAEGFSVLAATAFLYGLSEFSWATYALLFLVPDVSMLGYLWNARIGSYTYNAAHTYVWPLALVCLGVIYEEALLGGLVWLGHIGADRALGFGLKHPDAFSHTHL